MASSINGYIGQVNPGNGTVYSVGSTAYGVCSTATATAAKTVDMTGFTLITGATIFVKFTYANSATDTAPTLNVNSTGAKAIVSMTGKAAGWQDGAVVCLTYDGTSWVINSDNWAAIQFLGDADVDDLKNPGNYIFAGSQLASYTYANHLPQVYGLENITWHIEVKNIQSTTIDSNIRVEQYAHAIYYINSTNYSFTYFRYNTPSGGWSAWVREYPWQASKLIAKSGSRYDLNNLLTPGRYACGSGIMNYVDNKPVSTTGKGWEIIVRELIAENSQYILQEARDASNNRYWRTTADTGTTWTDWAQDTTTLNVTTDQGGTSIQYTDNTGTESDFDIPSNNGTYKFYMNVTSATSPYLYIYLDEDFTSTAMVYGKIFLYPYNVIGNFDELQFNFYYRDTTDALENCYFFDHFDKVTSMSALLDTTTHKVVLKVPNVARYTTYTAEVYMGATPYKNIVSNMDRFTPSGENWTETAFTRRSLDDVIGGSFQPKITAEGVLSGDGAGNITGNQTSEADGLGTYSPNMLGIDTTPTSGSSNLITSGGVYNALANGSGKVVIVTNSTTYAEVSAILAAGDFPVYKYSPDSSKDCYLPFEHKDSTTQYYFSSGYYNGWQTAVAYAVLTSGNNWSLNTKVLALVDTSTNKIQADLITANVTTVSSNTTLGASHANCLLKCTGAITITIPSSLTSADEIEIMNYGTGTVTVTAAAAVTLNGVAGNSKTIPDQYTSAVLKRVGSNEWVIQGAIS